MVVGAPSVTKQCLRLGLFDEIHLDLVPVVLGGGIRLSEDGRVLVHLEITAASGTPTMTHLTYRVVRLPSATQAEPERAHQECSATTRRMSLGAPRRAPSGWLPTCFRSLVRRYPEHKQAGQPSQAPPRINVRPGNSLTSRQAWIRAGTMRK